MSGNITFSLHLRDSSPKIKNVVISYSPSSCFKHMSFFLLLNTKEDILKNVGNQTVNCLVLTFFKISSFLFNRRMKIIQCWNNMRASKL